MFLHGQMHRAINILTAAQNHMRFRHPRFAVTDMVMNGVLSDLVRDGLVKRYRVGTPTLWTYEYSLTFEGWVLATKLVTGEVKAYAWVRP